MTPRIQRALVWQALDGLPPSVADPLPAALIASLGLPDRGTAFRDAHFPPPSADLDALNRFRSPAQIRLIVEEFFLFQLGVLLRRRERANERKLRAVTVDDRMRASARAILPFTLTAGQRTAIKAIVGDMQRPAPMNRLLQGDVGSGKTIVASLAALVAMENGLQVALMAPTEILAEQHALTLQRLFATTRFRVQSLSGRLTEGERRKVRSALVGGIIDLVVGTHALVQENVGFARLGLVIVDEQHRFGVVQRSQLREKGVTPDVLVMTATPIPRTLALTTYGDLDLTVIRDRPAGRQPVADDRPPGDAARRGLAASCAVSSRRGGRPTSSTRSSRRATRWTCAMPLRWPTICSRRCFPNGASDCCTAGCQPDAKERLMRAFAAGELHVLVSTTVVEVGVDVPNATVMVVEHAERFGLSQLHQLRGRVGRGRAASHCVLLYQPPLSDEARDRLKAMAETTDGFLLAERDLQLRGPGDFFGTRQSGLPTLRIGDLVRDAPLMEQAREAAGAWLATAPLQDPVVQFVRGDLGGTVRAGRRRVGACGSLRDRSRAGGCVRPTGRGCGRPPIACARRCSMSWPHGSPAPESWTWFAGTGAVGIEALSRGAAHVTFVEQDPRACRLIDANLRHCGVTGGYTMVRAAFERAERGDRAAGVRHHLPRSPVRRAGAGRLGGGGSRAAGAGGARGARTCGASRSARARGPAAVPPPAIRRQRAGVL